MILKVFQLCIMCNTILTIMSHESGRWINETCPRNVEKFVVLLRTILFIFGCISTNLIDSWDHMIICFFDWRGVNQWLFSNNSIWRYPYSQKIVGIVNLAESSFAPSNIGKNQMSGLFLSVCVHMNCIFVKFYLTQDYELHIPKRKSISIAILNGWGNMWWIRQIVTMDVFWLKCTLLSIVTIYTQNELILFLWSKSPVIFEYPFTIFLGR